MAYTPIPGGSGGGGLSGVTANAVVYGDPAGSGAGAWDATLLKFDPATSTLSVLNATNSAGKNATIEVGAAGTSGGTAGFVFTIPGGNSWSFYVDNPATTPFADPIVLKRGTTQIFKGTQNWFYVGGTDGSNDDQLGAQMLGILPLATFPGTVLYGGTTALSTEATVLMLRNRYNASASGSIALEFMCNQGVGSTVASGSAQSKIVGRHTGVGAGGLSIWTKNTGVYTQGIDVDDKQNITIGVAALATTATNGDLYITSCSGVPTGVPTTKTGRPPIRYDSLNNDLYAYDYTGVAWNLV